MLRYLLLLSFPSFAVHSLLVPAIAGFATVRLSGSNGETLQGARAGFLLGAAAGLLIFLVSAAVQLAVLSAQGREVLLEPAREMAEGIAAPAELTRWLEDPVVFAVAVALGMALEAVVLAGVSGAGGALAARRQAIR